MYVCCILYKPVFFSPISSIKFHSQARHTILTQHMIHFHTPCNPQSITPIPSFHSQSSVTNELQNGREKTRLFPPPVPCMSRNRKASKKVLPTPSFRQGLMLRGSYSLLFVLLFGIPIFIRTFASVNDMLMINKNGTMV